MGLYIGRCDDSHRDVWNAFVARQPMPSFYHRYEWRDINRKSLGHESCYLGAFEDDRLVGVFPLVHVKSRLFGNIACSMPFVNYGGPVGDRDEIEAALVDEAVRVAEAWGVDFLEIRSRRNLGGGLPTSLHKVSLTVEMSAGADALWAGFKTELRQHIRRGYKHGFTAKVGGPELVDDFYGVLAEAWRNTGTPIYAKTYLQHVARTFADHVRICVVYQGATPAAASFQAHEGTTAEGLWLGSRSRFRHDYAGYVLYWELLKDAANRGCRQFNLGRSTSHSGGEQFKRKWNACPEQLYWQYVLRTRQSIPQINVRNPRYQAAMWCWRHLPVGVTKVVGPPIARNIP
jgi:FemAB-related protein (PEP-CTERM system-associated)